METEVILLFHKNPPLLFILSQINPYRIYSAVVNQKIQTDKISYVIVY